MTGDGILILSGGVHAACDERILCRCLEGGSKKQRNVPNGKAFEASCASLTKTSPIQISNIDLLLSFSDFHTKEQINPQACLILLRTLNLPSASVCHQSLRLMVYQCVGWIMSTHAIASATKFPISAPHLVPWSRRIVLHGPVKAHRALQQGTSHCAASNSFSSMKH